MISLKQRACGLVGAPRALSVGMLDIARVPETSSGPCVGRNPVLQSMLVAQKRAHLRLEDITCFAPRLCALNALSTSRTQHHLRREFLASVVVASALMRAF